jgi:hypothetical protein
MRRALILGLVVLAVAAWVALRQTGETWVVVFSVEDAGLSFNDLCTPSPKIKGGFATGPSSYGGMWEVDSRADGEDVAACYEAQGGTADVHPATDEERQQLEDRRGLQADQD